MVKLGENCSAKKIFHTSFKNWHISLRFPPKTRSSFILTPIILDVNKRIHINGILQFIIPFYDLSQIWDSLLILD